MSIKCSRFWVVYESVSSEAINPIYLGIGGTEIEEYMKEHPMPEDPVYSKDDLIYDITESSGFLSLMDAMKPETRDYVVELINDLMLG